MRSQLTVLLLLFLTSYPSAQAWEPIDLPAPSSPAPAWFRCHIQVPDRLVFPEANNERDLWRSSTMLVLSDLPGGAEVFLNGVKIISEATVANGRSKRFKVPKDILVAEKFNTLTIHMREGSFSTPPLLIDYFNELRLGPQWEKSLTKPGAADLAILDQRPARAYYTPAGFRLSATPLDSTLEPIPGRQTSPAEALAALETDDDLIVELLLHEPRVAQPTHVSFDARGRMWVSQYRQYPYPAGVKMLSRDQYYRSKYDKVSPAPPYHDPGADLISVHQDTDGDGVYDQHKNILEGLNMANSALRGWGGFWVMHTPYLLFYPDTDGDDIPDRAPEVRLQGFGLEDTHSVANGLAWGPDGWLYGGQGSTTTSRVTRPGIDPEDAEGTYNEGCMVWRYHPQTKEYEIFADGGGNTFGLSFDAEGRLFSGHNGGGTRGWHHIQGGQFLKQGKNPGKFGPPPNPYSFGELQMMRSSNPVVRFSHMSILVAGSAMPERTRGKLLCADPLHHHLILAERKTRGSTFETTDLGFPLRTKEITFRPVYLANAPDGSLVVADFCEEYIAHGQNYQGQIDPTSGRIYRLRGREESLESDLNLEVKGSAELVGLLAHPNLWHRQTAARLLGQRGDRESIPLLLAALAKPEPHPALEALWALHQMGELDPSRAARALGHAQPAVRAWAIRLMGDGRGLADEFSAELSKLLQSESSPEVRCQILSTATRLPAEQALQLVQDLELPAADNDDPFIPLMLWFVIESHCAEHPERVLKMFEHAPLWSQPVIEANIIPRLMRRFAEAGTRADLMRCARLLELAPGEEAKASLLAGFEQAFTGRIPPAFPEALSAALGTSSISMQIRQGEPDALARGIASLTDPATPQPERLEAIYAFGTYRHAPAVDHLMKLATTGGAPAQAAALSALQIYDSPEIGTALASAYSEMPPEIRPSVLNLLGSRSAWALEMLRSPSIPKAQLDPDLVARMRLHQSPKLQELLEQHFPSQADRPGASAETVRRILAEKPGDPYRGEPIYAARCASCHTLFFKGGQVGPDLTRYQRDDLSTMLNSILDPNAEIREGYENVIATTKDGRLLSGFLAEEDANTIVLRAFDNTTTTIPRDQIAKLAPAGRSLMPEGLLTGLDDQQLRDLFAYLRISQPIIK